MNIFDLHCDTATELYRRRLSFDNGETHLNAAALSGHRVVQCFAVFLDDREHPLPGTDFFHAVCDKVFPQLNRPGITPILTVEGAGALARNPGWIEALCRRRCRMASLVWNGRNPLATGAATDDRAPLTAWGCEAVRALTENGILLDVSHLSTAGTEHLLTLTDRPVAASHSNAKGVRNHLRNLSDGHAREIFRRGGLVGLNLYPPFLSEGKATADDVLRHAEHFFALGGERGVALGCDFDGVDALPEGIEGFADLPKLYRRFEQAFGSRIADCVFYGNAARFFRLT